MKQIIYTLMLLVFSLTTLKAQNNTITITTKDNVGGTLLVQNLQSLKIDTVDFREGKIVLLNKTKETTPYAFARLSPRAFFLFFVEPKKNMVIDIKGQNLTINNVQGSASSQKYQALQKRQAIFSKTSQLLQQEYNKPKSNKDSIGKALNYVNTQLNNAFIEFIDNNKNSNMSAYMLYDVASRNQQVQPEQITEMYNRLGTEGKQTHFGKALKKQLSKISAMKLGNEAPNFVLKDENGKTHSLKSLRGKYVLLDFWASWCGPCVKEIPNLKKAYAQYKSKGFEIISVSIDRKEAAWKKALFKHKMPWIHVIDDMDLKKRITQNLYHVPTIPRTVLLDKNGLVIGRDFRGEALEKMLTSIFK